MLYLAPPVSEPGRFFLETIREAQPLRNNPDFELQYLAAAPFYRTIHPFRWLTPGMNAIQCGCTEWMIEFGVSIPLILSAVVGTAGKVLVIEPDQRNIDALTKYLECHSISNVKIVKKAVWSEPGEMDFTFYADRTSSNVLTIVQDRAEWRNDPGYVGRPTRIEKIEVDTVDNITAAESMSPGFINVTINDCEYEAIQGMTGNLQKGTMVGWLFGGDRTWWNDCFDFLADHGHDAIVGNFPYTHRGPSRADGSPTLLPLESVPQEMFAVSMPADKASALELPSATLTKVPGSKDFAWQTS